MTKIENAFAWLAWSALTSLLIVILLLILMPSKVTGYSLDHDKGDAIAIKKHIDWAEDITIHLDRSITLQEAVEVIKELNKTVK